MSPKIMKCKSEHVSCRFNKHCFNGSIPNPFSVTLQAGDSHGRTLTPIIKNRFTGLEKHFIHFYDEHVFARNFDLLYKFGILFL